MSSRILKRFSFGKKPISISTRDSNVSVAVVQAAQALRLQLSEKTSNETGGSESSSPFDKLVDLAKAATESPKLPESAVRLMARTLASQPNYKGSISAANLQLIFRAVAKHNADLEFSTQLYMDLYRHSKLNPAERLENGRIFYELLRSRGLTAEADRMVAALLRDNSSAVTNEFISSLLAVLVEDLPASHKSNSDVLASGIMAIVGSLGKQPSPAILDQCIQALLSCKSISGLEELANYIYVQNPHFDIADQVAIVFLDAYLQLPNTQNRYGQKVLSLSLAKLTDDTPLEVCELFLMALIHFQEPVTQGSKIYDIITQKYDPSVDYTKETWDVLAQWSVYSALSPLTSFKETVLNRMPSEYCDSLTLRGILLAATDKAQCSEQQITDLVEFFKSELDIAPDAAACEILMRRALRAVEVEHARRIFIDSNTDWNADSNKYISVLSDLLVAMARTTSIPRQTVMDTYQRVRLFAPRLSYEAQVTLLEMFLEVGKNDSTAAGIFITEQYNDRPDLPVDEHREIFDLLFAKVLSAQTEEEAWDLFVLLNCTIHIPHEAYYPLQQKLCSLGRPDAAHLLFRQLRSRSKQEGILPPPEEMYMMLFSEYAKWKYEEGTTELEVYFRVDLNNEMTPALMNRMLGAYAALNDGHKVSSLWTEMLGLPRGGVHGPNNETMCIMLQFFSANLGIEAVEDLWTKMPVTLKIAPTRESLKQYVIANCYHGYYTRALEIVKMAPKKYNIEIDGDVVRALYNWTMLPARKQEIREFAIQHYPKEWAALEASDGALKEILLPTEDETGETDEVSLRLAAINQLQAQENAGLMKQS